MAQERNSRSKADIEHSASEAVRVIAEAAREAAKVVADAAAESIKVTSARASNDHDLLVVLNTKMEDLKNSIVDLRTGTSAKIEDHESRIRLAETAITRMATWGTALVFVIGIAQFVVGKFFFK